MMNLKYLLSKIIVMVVLTMMVGFQSANAQSAKSSKVKEVVPGERHPEDIAIDKKMVAQGIKPTRTSSNSAVPERHPEDMAIDKKMAAKGKKPTRTSSSSAIPDRHPEDVAIDQKMASQKPPQATPEKTKAADNDYAAAEAARAKAESVPKMRHDGTEGSQPQLRVKKEPTLNHGLEHNRDGSVRKPGDPIEPERVRKKKAKVQPLDEKLQDADGDGEIDKPVPVTISKKKNN